MIRVTEICQEEKLDNYLETKGEAEKLKKTIPGLIFALIGFCLSRVDVFSTLSPFASAFLATVPFKYCSGAFTGSVIGYLVSLPVQNTVKSLLCLLLICLVRLLVHKRISNLEGGRFELLLTLFAVAITDISQNLITKGELTAYLLSAVEIGISFCSSYFFSRSFRTPVMNMGITNLATGDKLSLGISFCVFVMSFSGISVGGFSPAVLLGCVILCIAAYCKGTSFGSVVGICLGIALSIKPESRFLFPAFALSGLVGGVFAPMGQTAVGISSCLSFCFCCVLGGLEESFLPAVIECAAACAFFMLLPPVWLTKITEFIRKNSVVSDDDVNLQVSEVLKKASGNIYSFCKTVDEVSTRLDRIINPEVNRLFFDLQQNVCDGCIKKSICWNDNFNTTAKDVLMIMGIEKRGKNKLLIERHCPRLHELKKQINHGKGQYSLSMLTKAKNREMRCLLTEQFSGMGDFLGELSEKIAKSRTVDCAKSTALRAVIIDQGVYIDSLSCYNGDEGRIGIEILCLERPFETDYKKIQTILEEATERRFDPPQINNTETGTQLSFEEKSAFSLVVGSAQRPLVKDAPCGDSLAFCRRNDVSTAVILSDGMGTGSSAALDSMMAVSLMQELLSGGFSFESSVKIVNSALIMKSTDESMATMDGLSVNLYTGTAEFYKAGAAISFIRSDREIMIVEENSLPLGILREVHFKKSVFTLKAGDIVLLVSDGITAEDCGWINDELLSWSTNNMEDLACHIVELAALRQDKFTADDLTAVAVKLVKNK